MTNRARFVKWVDQGSELVVVGPVQIATVNPTGAPSSQPIKTHWQDVTCMDADANGQLVAVGVQTKPDQARLEIWDLKKRRNRTLRLGPEITSLTFSPDRRFVICCCRSTVHVVRVQDLSQVDTRNLSPSVIEYTYSLSFYAPRIFVCTLSDGTVHACSLGKKMTDRTILRGHGQCVSCAVIDHGRRIAAITIKGYNRTGGERDELLTASLSGQSVKSISLHKQPFAVVDSGGGSSVIVGFRDGEVRRIACP